MQKRKKIHTIVALALSAALLLTACGGEQQPQTSEAESASDTTAASEPEESQDNENGDPLKISIIVYSPTGYVPIQGTDVQKYLEERFNVEFEVIPVDKSQSEQFNLYFAQGGTADVVMVGGEPTQLVDQGIFREISWDDLTERMPVWMSKLESLVGDTALVETLSKYNNNNYCIPFTNGAYSESGIMIARKDWMDKVGISSVDSLEDFEALLEAFTYGDPDGNGQDDTYGIHGGQRYKFNYVWGSYGIMPESYYVWDDKVVYSNTTEQYKNVLKLLNKWYEAGYIDPEFITDDRTTQRNKWSEGKFGVLEDNAFWCDSARGDSGVLAMLEAKNADAEFYFMSPFEGPDGEIGSYLDFPGLRGDGSVYFGANASDEVVYKIMEIKEAMASDWDLFTRCYYGVEGEDYTTDGEKIVLIDKSTDPEYIAQTGIYSTWALIPLTLDWMAKTMNERDELIHGMSLSQPTVYKGVAFMTTGTNESLSIKGEDVKKIVDEYYLNAIRGDVDIDATWDNYVQEAMNAGLSDILEEYETLRK